MRGGWINKIGLRNPGIRNVTFNRRHIYSVVGLELDDWWKILEVLPHGIDVELMASTHGGAGGRFSTPTSIRRRSGK